MKKKLFTPRLNGAPGPDTTASQVRPSSLTAHRREIDPQRVLFIGGLGRSGTTMLELSIATDDRVVSLGEVTHLWRRSLLDDESCGCGLAFSRCTFWQTVGEVAFGGWTHVDAQRVMDLKRRLDRSLQTPRLRAGLGNSTWRAEVREYASYYARIYQAASAITGCPVVVDSSKQASLPHLLRADPQIDLRVLHCVRDSRAVAYSWTKKVARPESQSDHHAFMVQYSPPQTALKWMQHNIVVEGLRSYGMPVQRVRYEDWAADPRGVVERIITFTGLPRQSNDSLGARTVTLTNAHTCSGNPARFRRGTVTVQADERWREELPAASRRLVTAATLPMLTIYGYLRPRQDRLNRTRPSGPKTGDSSMTPRSTEQ